jgi:PAS domain S-box-containing protein
MDFMGETSFIESGLQHPWLEDSRLAAHATSAAPVWLWRLDGGRVLWANPAACAALGVETFGELASRIFAPDAPARVHIARLAATLPHSGAARLERLRGFAGRGPHMLGRPLVCSCALFRRDDIAGVLVAAAEPAGPALSLAERVKRLDFPPGTAFAVFAPDGAALFATPQAQRRLGAATTVAAIEAQALAATAVATGEAAGATSVGPMTLRRIGGGASMVLLGRFKSAGESAGTTPEVAMSGDPAAGDGTVATEYLPAPRSPPPEAEQRRHPLRFVWQTDPDGRFTLGSDEFTEVIGTPNAIALGRPWHEINADLGVDPAGRFAAATATRETWSNVTISWPIEGSDERLDVELSGLPAFDRDRTFLGYRGFGVCRDIDRIERLRSMRRLALLAPALAHAEAPEPPSGVPDRHDDEAGETHPVAPNVVPFPGPTEHKSPVLSPGEHVAFRELARQLAARLQNAEATQNHARDPAKPPPAIPAAGQAVAASERPAAWMFDDTQPAIDDHALLNRLPVGILVYHLDKLLFANRAFLTMTGYPHIGALADAGGLDALFVEAGVGALADTREGAQRLAIATRGGTRLPVEGRLFAIHWNREPAFAVLLTKNETNERIRTVEAALRRVESEAHELRTMLEGTTDAILVVDEAGLVLSGNRGSEIMFARSPSELEGTAFASLFAPQSRDAAAAAFAHAMRSSGGACARLDVDTRDGGVVQASVTLNRLGEGTNRVGAAIRDIAMLRVDAPPPAPQPAKPAGLDKSEALAKLCHDARTPLNSILGFCDIMLEERYGPIGNDRYRDYVADVRQAGADLMALLVDAVDLANIEAGTFRLTPSAINLNAVVNGCVGEKQPDANAGHVIVRTSLSPSGQRITADPGAVRQMVANLLGYAIKGSRPGGQVIISTGITPDGRVVLRVRDNGDGLSEKALEAALRPAGPQATTPPLSFPGHTLPLTKALAEATGARFKITSRPHEGSLFELTFARDPEVAP